jgi:hypothetical protein
VALTKKKKKKEPLETQATKTNYAKHLRVSTEFLKIYDE